ncbi:Uma2 family endonuclease [Nonomuraea sp. MG754425]|uniref:Uma2 family endonuclease n=1 Tax=Nonomuraea sp. MG754425 TaxID=2570319 RepID=UPI001F262A24|nr:Uma2 family endonuclease [Nonomuraea sp. MG754425]MCF6473921.1 Uma2 family endonuclease [Nonomuraea sp. MG754425]
MSALPADGWLDAHPPPGRVGPFSVPHAEEGYTVDDWLKLPETGERIELIDGSFLVSPMPNYDHVLAAKRLLRIIDDARPEDYEVVETGNLEVRGDGLIPDIVVGHAAAMPGAARLSSDDVVCVVEIVSPGKSGHQRDYVIKPPKYAAGGIPFFLRVELQGDGAPRVEAFGLGPQGYELVAEAKAGDRLTIEIPFPVTFDPAVLVSTRR